MFVKLFVQILDSSIADNRRLRHFFTDLLLCADGDGNVVMTNAAIARRIGAPLEEVEWGLEELQKADPTSKTPDCEGRRIQKIEGTGYGWNIVNFETYRALRDSDQLRAVTRERVKRFRDKQKQEKGGACNVTETQGNACNPMQKESQSTEGEKESETKSEKKQTPRRQAASDDGDFAAACEVLLPEGSDAALSDAWSRWQSYRQSKHQEPGKRLRWTQHAARAAVRQFVKYGASHGGQIVSDRVDTAIAGGWQGPNFDSIQATAPKSNPQTHSKTYGW